MCSHNLKTQRPLWQPLNDMPHTPTDTPKTPTLIRLTDVEFRRENRLILSQVNLSVNRGDFMAVTGPNGGGKTTLLRLMLRLARPTGGSVEYLDGDTSSRSLHIGYLPQKNMIDSRFPISVREVIASGLMNGSNPKISPTDPRVEETLRLIELESHASNPIGALSGGQLQRVLLGRALVSGPAVLILDEPLSYLDSYFEERLYEILAGLREHTTIILVSHQMSRIESMASRHIIVDHNIHECHGTHHFVPCDCD